MLALLQQCPLGHYNIGIKLQQFAECDSYKGSLMHGAMGHAMAAHSPAFYQQWGQASQAQQPHGFILRPPRDPRTELPAGSLIEFELLLFGQANAYREDFFASLWQFAKLGFGPRRASFTIEYIDAQLPHGSQRLYAPGCPPLAEPPLASLSDWIGYRCEPLWQLLQQQTYLVNIQALSPILLKQQQRQLSQAPNLNQMLAACERRLRQLIHFYHSSELAERLKAPFPLHNRRNSSDKSYMQAWPRFQKSSQRELNFDGLLGDWSYWQLEQLDMISWFAIGELLHIGAKSNFGLGQYRFSVAPLANELALAQMANA